MDGPCLGAVIISGVPLVYLALIRLIREKWVSSALLITIAMVASLLIGELFAAGEVAWIMALGALFRRLDCRKGEERIEKSHRPDSSNCKKSIR